MDIIDAAIAIRKIMGSTGSAITDAVDAWLNSHPEATTTVEDGSITVAKLHEDLAAEVAKISDIETALATKANIDGSYANMTVGNAEQLVSTVGVEDKVPYTFRTSGGANDIGDRETDKLVGGTLAWNQLVQNGNFTSTTGLTADFSSISASGNVLTMTASENGRTTFGVKSFNANAYKQVVGHKYLAMVETKVNSACQIMQQVFNIGSWVNVAANTWTTLSRIFQLASVTDNYTLRLNVYSGSTTPLPNDQQAQFRNCVVFDLTQMFGSTIADYIYSLETATAGSGVAYFRKLFPAPYYAYNAGSLESVQTSAHNMTGFNQWDEQWEVGSYDANGQPITQSNTIRTKNYIPCIPNTTYFYHNGSNQGSVVLFYGGGQDFISSVNKDADTTFTTPADAHYIRFRTYGDYGTTYKNDICINLHWDGERDGEYEPYTLHSYPLDDVVLRGIPKLDADNKLYYDGDTYEADGTVTRNYTLVTFNGTENGWSKENTYDTATRFDFTPETALKAKGNGGIVSSWLPVGTIGTNGLECINVHASAGKIMTQILTSKLSSADVTGWKAYLANHPLTVVYELATPTTESADPFQNPQIVNDWGTEEYVDAGVTASTPTRDVAIPVGHETIYSPNLRAKLEMAPDSPDGNGDYIVRQTSGVNTYVPLVIPTELPTNPSSDGTYILKATVSSGTTTLSWEAQT